MDEIYSENDLVNIVPKLLQNISVFEDKATVVGLKGELGAGKTTLVQTLAKELKIVEPVVSPTFVIAKFYQTHDKRWDKLIHIDAYRIEKKEELEILGWAEWLKKYNTLIIVEWPEKIEEIMPKDYQLFLIEHKDNQRQIKKYAKN